MLAAGWTRETYSTWITQKPVSYSDNIFYFVKISRLLWTTLTWAIWVVEYNRTCQAWLLQPFLMTKMQLSGSWIKNMWSLKNVTISNLDGQCTNARTNLAPKVCPCQCVGPLQESLACSYDPRRVLWPISSMNPPAPMCIQIWVFNLHLGRQFPNTTRLRQRSNLRLPNI